MSTPKAAHTEILRGYRLVEPLAPQGPGELWKCTAPGGRLKVVRFLAGAARDFKSFQLLQSLRHPGLVALERVEQLGNEIVLIRELAERTLNDALVEYQLEGRSGLPRAEALAYLRDVAEALDFAASTYGLQHLAISPRVVTLDGRRATVVDFGLAHCLTQRAGGLSEARKLGAFALPHAAPELLRGSVTLACDQYSLAVTYHEILTGGALLGDTVDLSGLPECERPIVARALSRDPAERFANCLEFIHTLLRHDHAPAQAAPAAARSEAPGENARPSRSAIARRRRPADAPVAPSRELPKAARSSGRLARPSKRVPTLAAAIAPTTLPGYRLLTCTEHNQGGEVWKAETDHGERRRVRLLFGVDPHRADADGPPLDRLRALTHPRLARTEYHEWPNRLAAICDAGKLSLAARFRRCQAAGMTGIPRDELLGYLRDTADAIDSLAATHRLRHLHLNPRTLFAADGSICIADHGLAQLFWLPSGQQAALLNPRYSAPELLQGNATRSADVYSLALLYAELLTGYHPFRQLSNAALLAHRRDRPDVTMLPASDRAAVLRALHADPEQRFVCCTDFVTAIAGAAPANGATANGDPNQQPAPGASRLIVGRMTPAQVVGELVLAAAGVMELREYRKIRYVFRPGQAIEHHCFARLLPGTAWLKMEGFRQQWRAQATACDADHFRFVVPAQSRIWDRVLGRRLELEVDVRLQRPHTGIGTLTEIAIVVNPVAPVCERAARHLEEVGPQLLESVRNYLQAHRERRSQQRLPFDAAVQICPVFPNLRRGEPIESKTRDISLHGVGLVLPQHPQTVQVAVRLAPQPGAELISVPGRVVRAVPIGDGKFDVGVCFATQPTVAPAPKAAVPAGVS